MYAIVNIAGQQMKVEKDQHIFVHRLSGKEGDKITFDDVLFVENGGKMDIGSPAVAGASVSAKVVEHVKGDKVKVFKKKRRKGYQTLNGHRQYFTKIAIDGISIDGKATKDSKKSEDKPTDAKAKTKKAEPKKTEAKKDTSTAKAKTDDLSKIEGVGKKIAEVLNEAGINSFKDLASTSVDKLNKILEDAGSEYASHVPDTWPKQAKLAAEGKTEELEKLQKELDGGIRHDDLATIEGVGKKIGEKLNDAGIHSYKNLAGTSVKELNKILEDAGSEYASHVPDTWPKQAKLAAEGKTEELEKLQKELDGGIRHDDFSKIEGVGKKTGEKLNDAGIHSYKNLAGTSVKELNKILEEAGSAYASFDPSTWPEQAKLAAEGKFDELEKLQEKLDGGKE
jgi:large subunit ribosomal protein L21